MRTTTSSPDTASGCPPTVLSTSPVGRATGALGHRARTWVVVVLVVAVTVLVAVDLVLLASVMVRFAGRW